jgi:hypothetical protein
MMLHVSCIGTESDFTMGGGGGGGGVEMKQVTFPRGSETSSPPKKINYKPGKRISSISHNNFV